MRISESMAMRAAPVVRSFGCLYNSNPSLKPKSSSHSPRLGRQLTDPPLLHAPTGVFTRRARHRQGPHRLSRSMRLRRPVSAALLLLVGAAASTSTGPASAAAAAATPGSSKKGGWGLRESLLPHCGKQQQYSEGSASMAATSASSSSSSSSSARRKRSEMTPSPVPHALELGSGSGARHRAASPTSAYHDEDENDKVALIQKLVSLEGGAAAVAKAGGFDVNKLAATGVTLGYFALWFALNVYYNIVNKHVLNALPLPLTVATVQLGVGAVYVLLSWLLGLRAAPQLTPEGRKGLWPIAVYHGSGQLFTVLSLGAAAVSFTHIVKAMEPFFSALVAAVAFRQVFKPQVYASLIPVVLGVSVACAHDVSFSWPAFITAMASNLAFALRANFSKSAMTLFKSGKGNKNMTPANIYGVVTIMAFLLATPLALLWEGVDLQPTWRIATEKTEPRALALNVLLSGLFHYLNNEVMYLALDNVHPITLAVGNTAKRVFIIVASLLVFRNPITTTGAVGSAVGILGVLGYSLVKQHYDNQK